MSQIVGGAVASVQTEVHKWAAKGRIFWVHPKGDEVMDPCSHLDPRHPGGDGGGQGPCLHPKVQEHPGGHTEHLPCFDPRHATSKGPCGGHDQNVPCTHLKSPHPGDELPKVPCVHRAPRHPGGDGTGRFGDCIHELAPVDTDQTLGLVFYDCDAAFRQKIRGLVSKLAGFGAKFAAPRVLAVFNRPFIGSYADIGGSEAADDPFWSHYCGFESKGRHYLQVTRGHDDGTIAHELGHAILGDQCVSIDSPGGNHTLTDPSEKGLAMSEGWAQFVKAALTLNRGDPRPLFPSWGKKYDFEKGELVERKDAAGKAQADLRIGPMQTIEFCVGTGLWDLFDTHNDGQDSLALDFRELFKVYRPSFETLKAGPKIPDFKDFVDRLASNQAASASALAAIRGQNAP